MTKEQFITLLRNPSNINLNLIKDMEEITERFPYFQNAHMLLAKQYHGHENIRYESHLRKASAYATDRRILYNLIQLETAGIAHMTVATDDVTTTESNFPATELEQNTTEPKLPVARDIVIQMTPSEIVEAITDPGHSVIEETENAQAVVSSKENAPNDPQSIIEQRLKELADAKQSTEEIVINQQSKEQESEKEIETIPVNSILQPTIINLEDRLKEETFVKSPEKTSTPTIISGNKSYSTDIHTFGDWLKIKSGAVLPNENMGDYQMPNVIEPAKTTPAKKPEDQIIDKFIKTEPRIVASKSEFYSPGNMARLSAREHEDLISETLARIYAQQGNNRKAIETYRKLSLKLPEKSAYFASLIRDLEKNNPTN